jgi:hypothetical protein
MAEDRQAACHAKDTAAADWRERPCTLDGLRPAGMCARCLIVAMFVAEKNGSGNCGIANMQRF